jgi:signal transduction histidine kinase
VPYGAPGRRRGNPYQLWRLSNGGRRTTLFDRGKHAGGGDQIMARSDRTNQKGPSDESERRFQGISRKILSEQEREREWAAKKIHDNIIQILAAIKLSTAMALQELEKGHPGRVKRSLENSISMIQNAIEETRRIHAELRPSALDGLGILAAIRGFCREFQENYPAIRLHKRMEVEESEVPLPLKIVIYRIVQKFRWCIGGKNWNWP